MPRFVKVFAFPLLKPIAKVDAKAGAKADHGGLHAMDEAVNTASFTPFGKDYRGGVSLATVGSPVRSAAPSGSW